MIAQILFAAALGITGFLFARQIKTVRRNIFMGKKLDISDRKPERWKNMLRVAFGQSKMGTRPLAALLHLCVYLGFVLINIEVLEIVVDGLTGNHRIFQPLLGSFYPVVIGFFEILGVLVMLACIIFLTRRHLVKVPRVSANELKGFPQQDATLILCIELVLMSALLIMNAADHQHGPFVVSQFIAPVFNNTSDAALHIIERSCWWLHILGIFAFLNYLPKSKHFHIILAFPNTWYAKLEPRGKFTNLESVTREVQLMMNPNAAPAVDSSNPEEPVKFGARDVTDLTWKNLLDAYTCTECGRCTSVCPANQTGKLLSPRKIMMSTRDRMEELGKKRDQYGPDYSDENPLLGNYITQEELWACTSCNACAEICPINIDPLSIIMELRRDLVMEQSLAPASLNTMFTNIENNGAPWQFSPMDRANWADETDNA